MRIRTREGVVLVQIGVNEFKDAVLLEEAFELIIKNLEHRPMLVDLSQVQTIPSLGIAVLMAIESLAHLRRSRIVFAGLQPAVRKSLEVVGVLGLLATYDLAEEALLELRRKT